MEHSDNAPVLPLLDEATGEPTAVIREVEDQRRIASDSTQPLGDRIEAFEDIIDFGSR